MRSRTRKHPRDWSDAEVAQIVARSDAALERGDVQVVDVVALRELRAAAVRRDAGQRAERVVDT